MIFDDIKKFYSAYRGRKCVIGYSCQGREIFAFHTGNSTGEQFISTYAIHAREWITSYLALRHIRIGAGVSGGWIIPLVNPDGACIAQSVYPLWKANSKGVDLNCNFDADWGKGELNTKIKGSENCIGDFPFSEPETAALRDFTLKIKPFVTFSFHTKGEEIYWEFNGLGDENGAEILSSATGYAVKKIPGSAGGYKDWCIQKLGIPAYTVECGPDSLNHPVTQYRKIKKCEKALKIFMENYGT